MDKIKILLSCGANAEPYQTAVEGLGAIAVMRKLPSVDTDFDGLILCGGTDVDPLRYGEEINGSEKIDYARDAAEFDLLKAYVEEGKPIFGICRGHQLINVFFGGSLYQDIPESVLHKKQEKQDSVHAVRALSDSILQKLYGEHFFVNSAHHQAIKALGDGLRATAIWEDRYIEAIEHTKYPILGVQWHPERTCFDYERDDTVSGAEIIKYFIELCRKHRDCK